MSWKEVDVWEIPDEDEKTEKEDSSEDEVEQIVRCLEVG